MIRYSEAVLNGHPDKFCDLIADRIVEEAYRFDLEAYAQVEVGVWSDRIWLSGGTMTRRPFTTDLLALIREVGARIGYTDGNVINVARYQLDQHMRIETGDPRPWTRHVNDQSIVMGWAGYDARTHFLPPEHFLAHRFRETLVDSIATGRLRREGPDGKLLVRLREERHSWRLEHVLVTLQQREATSMLELAARVNGTLQAAYADLQQSDRRWASAWKDVDLVVNPNGPLVNGGSDGDNGQTGRKLVMDFYGPRVPIGGGALSGKDLTHIDRAGAYAARQAAVEMVARGARECLVTVVYAPNVAEPLDVRFDIDGSVRPPAADRFRHEVLGNALSECRKVAHLGQGTHFYDPSLPWNRADVTRGGLDHGGHHEQAVQSYSVPAR